MTRLILNFTSINFHVPLSITSAPPPQAPLLPSTTARFGEYWWHFAWEISSELDSFATFLCWSTLSPIFLSPPCLSKSPEVNHPSPESQVYLTYNFFGFSQNVIAHSTFLTGGSVCKNDERMPGHPSVRPTLCTLLCSLVGCSSPCRLLLCWSQCWVKQVRPESFQCCVHACAPHSIWDPCWGSCHQVSPEETKVECPACCSFHSCSILKWPSDSAWAYLSYLMPQVWLPEAPWWALSWHHLPKWLCSLRYWSWAGWSTHPRGCSGQSQGSPLPKLFPWVQSYSSHGASKQKRTISHSLRNCRGKWQDFSNCFKAWHAHI